jgi:Family of unknown function (DUF6186)
LVTRAITIIGFAALILALFVLEFLARRKDSRIPTLGEWLGYVMRPKIGRLLVLLGWLWLGWHYFSRLPAEVVPSARLTA